MPEQQPDDEPSLELPSFGLRRRRRRGRKQGSRGEAAPPPAPAPEPASDVDERPEEEAPAPEPEPVGVAGEPAREAERQATPPEPYGAPDPPTGEAPPASASSRRRAFPGIGGRAAAVVTGAIVGVLLVGATWASLRFCEVVQGTSSCGNPGFFLLLAVLVAAAWLGRLLLRVFGVPEPGSTSLLGVGLIAVISLLFFVDLLLDPWMIVVVPAVGMAAYSLSHWVTVTFVGADPGDSMHR